MKIKLFIDIEICLLVSAQQIMKLRPTTPPPHPPTPPPPQDSDLAGVQEFN